MPAHSHGHYQCQAAMVQSDVDTSWTTPLKQRAEEKGELVCCQVSWQDLSDSELIKARRISIFLADSETVR